jgi:hypothetical protein
LTPSSQGSPSAGVRAGGGLIAAPQVLRDVVALGLPGSRLSLERGRSITSEVVYAAAAHRVQGLLWDAIESGDFSCPEDVMAIASDAYVAGLRSCLAVEELAVGALDALESAGVSARVLKGVAIAHLDHDDPARRIFGDIDLLVRADQHRAAMRALGDCGLSRVTPPVRLWWERRFGKAVVFRSVSGGELDLHLRLTGGYFGERLDHGLLWGDAGEPFMLGGRTATALDREGRLLHACMHSVLGGDSGLRTLHDIAHLVLVREADWMDTVDRAIEYGAEAVVAQALLATWSELALDPHHPSCAWANALEVSPEQAAAIATYRAAMDGRGWLHEGRGTLAALTTFDRARYLFGLALPSAASLKARRRGRVGHFRRARRRWR